MKSHKPNINVTLHNIPTSQDYKSKAKKDYSAFRSGLIDLFDSYTSKGSTEICQSIYSNAILGFTRNDIEVLIVAQLISQYLYKPLKFIDFDTCVRCVRHYQDFKEKELDKFF